MPRFEMPDNVGKKSEQEGQEPGSDKLRKIEEEKSEHIPTAEEVLSLFEKLVGENKFEDVRKLEDEQGLYLWEIKVSEDDGGSTEYLYIRKGDYRARGLAGGSAPETAIHKACFDSEGTPYTGYPVRKLRDGKWIEIP